MNFGIKTKTCNILTTATLATVASETALEAGAKIIGFLLTGQAVGDTASFVLSIGNISGQVPVASGQITPAGGTTNTREWWAGLISRINDNILALSGATANTINGWYPIAAPSVIPEAFAATLGNWTTYITLTTALAGQVIVFYTVDPPTIEGRIA